MAGADSLRVHFVEPMARPMGCRPVFGIAKTVAELFRYRRTVGEMHRLGTY